MGLRYSEFTVPLVKAVQEQQSQIEILEAEIEELQNIIENMEKTNDKLRMISKKSKHILFFKYGKPLINLATVKSNFY
ncbi:MAG: hypothetical protein R2764_05690 [Bacteroidales bacterium]